MPSSFTVANSLEAQNLAKEHVLITGLTGIQEAASMNVLPVDKTGTLTNNRPKIAELVPFGQQGDTELLKLAAAASDDTSNDSISTAILGAFKKQKLAMPERSSFTYWGLPQSLLRLQQFQTNLRIRLIRLCPQQIAGKIACKRWKSIARRGFLTTGS